VNSARISQSLPAKPNCRERTAEQPPAFKCTFFSESKINSPILSTSLGEGRAIKGRTLCEPGLTSARRTPANYSLLVEFPEADFLAAWFAYLNFGFARQNEAAAGGGRCRDI